MFIGTRKVVPWFMYWGACVWVGLCVDLCGSLWLYAVEGRQVLSVCASVGMYPVRVCVHVCLPPCLGGV